MTNNKSNNYDNGSILCIEMQHYVPGTCGCAVPFTYIVSFNMATLEGAYYYKAHFTDKETDIEKCSRN